MRSLVKPNEDVNPEKPRNIVETNTSKTALSENLVSEKDIKSEEEKSGDDSMNTREVDGNDSEEELELLLFQPSIENTCPNLNSEELKSFFIDVDDDDYENEDIDVGSIDTISVNEFNNSGSLYSDWDQETSLKHKITNPNFEDGDEDVDVVSEEIGSVHGVSGSDLELKLSETECEEEEFEGFEEVSPKKITKFKGVVMNLAKNSLSEEKSCEGLIQTLDQMNYSGSTAEKNTIEYQIANNKYNCDKKLFTDNEFKLCNSFDNIKEKFDSDLNASHDDDDKFKQFESRANSEITSEKYDNKRLNNEGKKEEVKAEELGKESLTSDNTSGFINPDKENAIAEQQMNPSSHNFSIVIDL
ncbi:hypothetical protein Avbf_03903 [Armadillidium vulgare]|nr:hypothetical protein Avbf_03903 [Armadillidium vulgare]